MPRSPPSSYPDPSPRHVHSPLPNPSLSPSLAPRQQREPSPPSTSYTTSGPRSPDPATATTSTAPTDCHQRRRHHHHGGVRRGRGATHLVSPPLKAGTPDPLTIPDPTEATPGRTSSVPAHLPAPDVCPRPADAPLPPPPGVTTQPQSGDRAHVPTGPRTPVPPLPAQLHGTGLRGLPLAHHRHQSP